jgi:hypothetical protein
MSQPNKSKTSCSIFVFAALIGYCTIFAHQAWSHFQIYTSPSQNVLERVNQAIQPISSSFNDLLWLCPIILAIVALWYAACQRRYPSHVKAMVIPRDADIDVQIKVARLNYLSSMRGNEADRVFEAGILGCALGLALYAMQMLLDVAPGAWIALQLAG